MNCFVIMPFAAEFDDVHTAIKGAVEEALAGQGSRCFRLDELRPAGRIGDRLIDELRTAELCVADLTGNNPNVMWEVGYAMALGTPTILVTQNIAELSFDLKDFQGLEYKRSQLTTSLRGPLKRMILDTIQSKASSGAMRDPSTSDRDNVISDLKDQLSELKSIVLNTMHSLRYDEADASVVRPKELREDLRALAGGWVDTETGTHSYGALIENDLIMPYCFAGDDQLTGVFYDWKRLGGYWVAKFAWLDGSFSGFSFLRQDSVDCLRGAYWIDRPGAVVPVTPPLTSGVPQTMIRIEAARPIPTWARIFHSEVMRDGIANRIACWLQG